MVALRSKCLLFLSQTSLLQFLAWPSKVTLSLGCLGKWAANGLRIRANTSCLQIAIRQKRLSSFVMQMSWSSVVLQMAEWVITCFHNPVNNANLRLIVKWLSLFRCKDRPEDGWIAAMTNICNESEGKMGQNNTNRLISISQMMQLWLVIFRLCNTFSFASKTTLKPSSRVNHHSLTVYDLPNLQNSLSVCTVSLINPFLANHLYLFTIFSRLQAVIPQQKKNTKRGEIRAAQKHFLQHVDWCGFHVAEMWSMQCCNGMSIIVCYL